MVRSHTRGVGVLLLVIGSAGAPLHPAALAQPAEQAAAAPIWAVPAPQGRDGALWAYMDRHVGALHRLNPMGVGRTLGDDSLNHRMGDSSASGVAEYYQWVEQARADLLSLDQSGYSEADRLDHDLLLHGLDQALLQRPLNGWQSPVSTMGGPQLWLPQMGQRVPLVTDKHYSDYLERLAQIETRITDTMENMRLGVEAGRVPPRVTVEPTVEQALAQGSSSIMADPTTSPFFGPFDDLPAHDPRRARAATIIAEQIAPAYLEFAQFLQNEYIPACRESVGISQGVDGPVAYDIALGVYTSLKLTADEVHQIGLDEVARIRSEMMEVIGRTDWEPVRTAEWESEEALFAAFVEYLRTDSRFYFDDAEDLLAGYRNISKLVDAEMPSLFGRLPRLPYGVRPIPTYAAKAGPTAYYYSGSVVGGVPGYFMANIYDLASRPKYDMVALTLHEAVPGHHHQIALAQELEDQHPVRKLMGSTAFSEGWGLYSERLGLEMGEDAVDDGVDRGLYADPYDDFGRLNFEIWRAIRLVVDSGIHAKGWTRERALDYALANSALTEFNARNEIDRYIGWPGQATAYKIGQLKILELRGRAEAALGERFDIRAFHDEVLENGAIPLPVLEARIERWISAEMSEG